MESVVIMYIYKLDRIIFSVIDKFFVYYGTDNVHSLYNYADKNYKHQSKKNCEVMLLSLMQFFYSYKRLLDIEYHYIIFLYGVFQKCFIFRQNRLQKIFVPAVSFQVETAQLL
jgi:hypothetical protein